MTAQKTDGEYGLFITAGNKCPMCKGYGLFTIDTGFRCENCLTYFDEQMQPTKRWTEEGYEFFETNAAPV